MSKAVLMLGWEYPPFITGGLGIATQHICNYLSLNNTVKLLLPFEGSKCLNEQYSIEDQILDNEKEFSFENMQSVVNTAIKDSTIVDSFGSTPHIPGRTISAYTPESECYEFNELLDQVETFAQTLANTSSSHRNKFDLIHCHDWLTMPAACRLKDKLNIPIVAHVHSISTDRNIGKKDVTANVEEYGLRYADKIIAVSHYSKEIMMDQYDLAADKISVIHNGVDTSITVQKKQGKLENICFIGRFTHQKKPLVFVKAAALVLKLHPNIQFTMAGDGVLMKEIVNTSEYKQHKNNIRLTGFLGVDEVDHLMMQSDLLCLPSVSDPFGLVAIEAGVRGCGVVLTENCGVREVMPSAKVVSTGSYEQLADVIISLIEHPEANKKLRFSCEQEASKMSWDKAVQLIEEVYNDL